MPAVPVVFIHGLWLHATSWDPWVQRFTEAGYAPIAPGWPGEPDTARAAREHPEAVAGSGINAVVEHFAEIIRRQPESPVLVGHSFGGLFVQKLLGMGLGRAGVAIDPGQFRGIRQLPISQLRSVFPVLRNPGNRKRAVALTTPQFKYAFGNALTQQESDALHDRYMIPSPIRALFEGALANVAPNSPATVDTANNTRGPLLLVSGRQDNTIPDVLVRAARDRYAASSAVTELVQFDRGHSLTVDHGWSEIADFSLDWLQRSGAGAAPGTDPASLPRLQAPFRTGEPSA